ncbi:MAG: hypothetical protein ISQ09_07210 [Rubripirellula sp.]|nr:hypothetical protein [Rubripirellula sp.]
MMRQSEMKTRVKAATILLCLLLIGCGQQTGDHVTPANSQDGSAPNANQATREPVASDLANSESADQVQDNEREVYELIDMEAAADEWKNWPTPEAMLVITGRQHGYIEPCGCTGLDRQKGGMARRYTLLEQLKEKGWPILAIDAGNQVRRFGRQAEIKLQQTVNGLKQMNYQAVGFGPDDLRLGVGELLSVAAGETEEDTLFASANVVLIDPSLMPQTKLIRVGRINIGVTSVIDPESITGQISDEITIKDPIQAARIAASNWRPDIVSLRVLMFYGSEEAAKKLALEVPEFKLIIVAGGAGEPTFQPVAIPGSRTKLILTGEKGMYAGLYGLFDRGEAKYARVPLTQQFEDAPEMRQLMKEYQDQLKDIGLSGLGLLPGIPHPSGQQFTGSQKCGECHTTAYDIWKSTPHALATDHLVKPPQERGDIARHFDPECLSCHSTGWNPQDYYPYLSGYVSLEASKHLLGNGCENCHGPGSEHVAAETSGSSVDPSRRDELRLSMRLPLSDAKKKCMTCHDLDNSPDFHDDNAFEEIYWPEVEHVGVD